jgi:hypothetical protein
MRELQSFGRLRRLNGGCLDPTSVSLRGRKKFLGPPFQGECRITQSELQNRVGESAFGVKLGGEGFQFAEEAAGFFHASQTNESGQAEGGFEPGLVDQLPPGLDRLLGELGLCFDPRECSHALAKVGLGFAEKVCYIRRQRRQGAGQGQELSFEPSE